ncbi:MAG TPA: TVP38/TMEM64 family protein [Planctomycetaceae bacterium]|nr:TVP38/TMEM64 family protein [Planctomycetaceae bacterium]
MTDGTVKPWVRQLSLVVFVAGAIIAWNRREEIEAFLGPLFESVNALGPWAPVVLALMYIPACLCFIPNTFLSPGVGFLLGPVWGLVTAIIGLVMGHTATFFVSRKLGRAWFYRRAAGNQRFRAVELACEREGFKIVTLTRLTPVFPSNVMSYFFGVTSLSVREFALGTAIGMLPRTIVYTTVGAAAKSFVDASGEDFLDQPLMQWATGIGIAVTIVVLAVIARIARRALNDAIARNEVPTGSATNAVEAIAVSATPTTADDAA